MPDSIDAIQQSHLQRLLEVTTTISSTLDLNQLLDRVLDAAADLTDSEIASILFWDDPAGQLEVAAANGTNLLSKNVTIPADNSIAGLVVRDGAPMILDDVKGKMQALGEIEALADCNIRNMAVVPLKTKRGILGALEAINKHEPDNFDDQDLVMLQALAAQASVSIENARLFQQTDLIAEFMHELKTPLMALTAASEILVRTASELSSEQKELLEMIERETSYLAQMAQEFLDLARLESGRTHITQETVDIAALITDIVQMQEPQAAARGISINCSLPPDLPLISADANRIKQVLLNLTSNAIKYNKIEGEIVIVVSVVEDKLEVEISDTGHGIPEASLPHLFDRFYRVPDAEGFTEGTGLGLTIAKRIVEEHGGRIEVESELNKGSTFRIYLPLSG